jgi:DNA-binding GntR family transcriptional regulator
VGVHVDDRAARKQKIYFSGVPLRGADRSSAPVESTGPRPAAQRSAVDLVIDEVRRSILAGSLRPGAPVSIAELSARLEVSHIPVREALRRLESEGLIELRRSRSAVVAPLSRDDLASVFHLRELLEGDVMARAVALYTVADLAAIQQAWAQLEIEPGDDAESLSARHTAFHSLLLRPAAGEWDWRLLDVTWQAGERYMFLILAETLADVPTQFRDVHRDFVEAAASGSAREARRAVKEHLASGLALIGPALADYT